MHPISIVTSLCAALAAASPVVNSKRESYAVKETHFVPRAWTRIGGAPADHVIDLNIALKQDRFHELEKALNEVSDPDHPRYGNHLSSDDVNELVKPSKHALDSVKQWLSESGISDLSFSPAKDWIRVSLPVNAVEDLLDTSFSVFRHEDGEHLVRTPQWSLPSHLHDFVTTIQPTTAFLRTQPDRRTIVPLEADNLAALDASDFPFPSPYIPGSPPPDVSKVCNVSAVTPDCLRTYYGTIDYKPAAAGKNRIGLTNYLGETNNRSDVRIFLQRYRPEAASTADTFQFDIIDGGDNQQTPNTPAQNAAGKDLEGNLDAETILSATYPTPLLAFNTGGMPPFTPDLNTPTNTNEPYLAWVQHVLGLPDSRIPQTISTSYGDDEQSVPPAYAQTVCNQFAQLGARGVSLLFSSGDYGVGRNGTCVSNDGKATPMFVPAFPASCPFVTTVGATHQFNPEVVAFDPRNGFASGGGFSNYFSRPLYQEPAVRGYLAQLGGQFKGLYNASGRAYPDIAAQGEHYITIWNGAVRLLDGTSASCPTTASIISLVNDALLAAGKKPLGFLNPFLYSRGFAALTDITSGSAIGCNSSGFPAERGWDPVTGLGTPRFRDLKNVALFST